MTTEENIILEIYNLANRLNVTKEEIIQAIENWSQENENQEITP